MAKGIISTGIPVRLQLIIVTILLVLLPVGIVGTVLYLEVVKEMDKVIVQSLQEQARLVEGIIENEYNSFSEESAEVTDFLEQLVIGEQGYVFILDTEGRYVLSKGRQRDGENIIEEKDETGREFIREMVKRAPNLSDEEVGIIRYPWRSSRTEALQEKIAVYDYFEPWGWVWGVSAVKDDFAGSIRAVRRVTLIIGFSFTALAIIAALIIGAAFARPISRLETVIDRVAEGDFTQRVSLKSGIRELKRLSKNFDEGLLMNMRQMLRSIREVTDTSHETGEKISNQVEGTLVFTNQMTEQLIEMRKQIHGLDGQISEASSGVEQIQATIVNVSKQIEQQSTAVTETSASIEEMNSSIQSVAKIAEEKQTATDSLLRITGRGGENVRQTNSIIQEIGVSINDMMNMITIINKVAAQTNLLAMNAAIEAAHAGEAGRGFAVVAEEIRNLSNSTGNSAKKISVQLKAIVERIQQATEMSTATGSSFQKIENEMKEFIHAFQEIASSTAELSTGSEEMLNAVSSLQDVAQEIQDGSEEMKSGSRDINDSLQALKVYSGSTVGSLEELIEKTDNVNYAQGNMTDLVISNSENTEKMAAEIRRFTIDEGKEAAAPAFSFSDLVRFSVGALLLQEWIGNVRHVINGENGEQKLPRLEKGRLQKWIDERAMKLFGEEVEFQKVLSLYDSLLNLTEEMSRARSAGETERVESLYRQMLATMMKAKSSLHGLRYALSDRLEVQQAPIEDSLEEVEEEE
jgi:methyl-accepting chemotaxis protein